MPKLTNADTIALTITGHQRDRRRSPKTRRTCPACSQKFRPNRKGQETCSRSCRTTLSNRRRMADKPVTHVSGTTLAEACVTRNVVCKPLNVLANSERFLTESHEVVPDLPDSGRLHPPHYVAELAKWVIELGGGWYATSRAEPTLSELERRALTATAAGMKRRPKVESPETEIEEVPGARWHRDGYYATLGDYISRPAVEPKRPKVTEVTEEPKVTEARSRLSVAWTPEAPRSRSTATWCALDTSPREPMPDVPEFMMRGRVAP